MANSAVPDGITLRQIKRYATLVKLLKKATLEKDKLNALIKKVFTKYGTYVYDNVVISLGPTTEFDAKAAARAFPEDVYPEYWKSVFDPSKLSADQKKPFNTTKKRLTTAVAEV